MGPLGLPAPDSGSVPRCCAGTPPPLRSLLISPLQPVPGTAPGDDGELPGALVCTLRTLPHTPWAQSLGAWHTSPEDTGTPLGTWHSRWEPGTRCWGP